MIAANNGRLSIDSTLTKGTTVTFTLPVATTAEEIPNE